MNLTDKQKQWLAWGIIAIVITLISTFLGVKYPIPEPPPFITDETDEEVILGTTHFTNLEAEDITATDDLVVTDDAAVGGDLTVTGSTTFTDDATFSADLKVTNDFHVGAQTTISVTNAGILTPTGTYQPIESAGTVTPTIAITDTAGLRYATGTLLVIINTSNTTINFADSGNVKTSSATALGQYDSFTLWFDATYWIEIAQTDN